MKDLWDYRSRSPSISALIRASQTERLCDVCLKLVPVDNFYYWNRRRCKECIKADRKEFRKNRTPAENIEYNKTRRLKYRSLKGNSKAITAIEYIWTAKRRCKERRNKKQISTTLEMYANGVSIIRIAAELKISYGTVSNILTKHFFYYKGENSELITRESKV